MQLRGGMPANKKEDEKKEKTEGQELRVQPPSCHCFFLVVPF